MFLTSGTLVQYLCDWGPTSDVKQEKFDIPKETYAKDSAKPYSISLHFISLQNVVYCDYCNLDHWQQISFIQESECSNFHTRKSIWKFYLQYGGHLASISICNWLESGHGHLPQVYCQIYFIGYCKTSSISRTKFQNLNVSCPLLQLSLPNPLKPGV